MSGPPLVPTGLYKIINVGDNFAASVLDGKVVGDKDSDATWFVENLIGGGVDNQVAIRYANGGIESFAGVTPPIEQGEPVIVDFALTTWTLKSTLTGNIEITVDDLAWTLISGSQNNPIVLERPTASGLPQLWIFVPQD